MNEKDFVAAILRGIARLKSVLRPFELRIQHYYLLLTLDGSSVAFKQLREEAGVSPARLSFLLKRLEAMKLIRRSLKPGSPRNRIAQITDEGQKILRNIESKLNAT